MISNLFFLMNMDTNENQLFLELMESLASTEQISIPALYHFSDLTPEELSQFCEAWPRLNEGRRRIIARHLADLAEENYVVDFSEVFGFCLEDAAAEVRLASLDGLWDSDRLTLVDPIVQLMQNDPDMRVRSLAAATLGHYVLMAEWEQLSAEKIKPVVEALLSQMEDPSASPAVKGAALESLGAASHPRVSTLIEDAYDSGDLDMQKSALFAMGRNADRRWLSVVRDEMMSSIVEMRLEAARASGGIGHEEAIPELGELISDEDLEVRLAAVAALGLIGGAVAQEILEDLSADPETADLHEAAREAVEELDWLGSKIDLSLLDWENDRDEDAIL